MAGIATADTAHADFVENLRSFKGAPNFSKRVGLEAELAEIAPQIAGELLAIGLKGNLSFQSSEYRYVEGGVARIFRTEEVLVKSSRIGNILIKPEDNSVDLAELARVTSTSLIEVVTEPLQFYQVYGFENGLLRLGRMGAKGTESGRALAIQVNVEMAKSPGDLQVEKILAILRNYLRRTNHDEIAKFLRIPPFRKKYVGLPQPGFMKLLFSKNYRPTIERLYMDSMYRSVLESIGDIKAWKYSDDDARAAVKSSIEKEGFVKVLLPVMKWNYVRYSSLMMFAMPDEWLSQYMISTGWFKPYPILEFREPNSDFNVVSHVEWILGLISASETLGDFDPKSLEGFLCQRYLLAQ